MKNFLTVTISALALQAQADQGISAYKFQSFDYPASKIEAYAGHLQYHQGVLAGLTPYNLQNLEDRYRRDNTDRTAQSLLVDCRDYYRNLYASNTLVIRAVYGYYDNFVLRDGKSGVYVGDRAEMEILRQKFMSRCPDAFSFACGFTGTPGSTQLRRTIVGPDRRPRNVVVELISSAASGDDRANRSGKDFNKPSAEQSLKSAFAEQAFLNGFTNADVLVYLGHARAGGGPSFYPPVLRSGSGSGSSSGGDPVDFGYYNSSRDGFVKMVNALQQSATPPKVLGLFACRSAPLFAGGQGSLSQTMATVLQRQNVTFIGTSGLTDSNTDLRNFEGLVDGLLAMRCGTGFRSGISVEVGGSKTTLTGPTP